MTGFLLRRLVKYIVLLLFASFLTFSLASVFFHPLDSLLQRNPRPPQAVIDAKAAELDLDQPIPVRYANWVSGAVRGDFGTTVGGQPVSDELWRRIGVSLRLVVLGSVIGTVAGVVLGAWGAIRQYRLSDRVITVLSLLVLSIPTFVMANLLILAALRVNSIVGVQVFEYTGETSACSERQLVRPVRRPRAASGAADFDFGILRDGRLQPVPAQRHAGRAGPGFHPHRTLQRPDPATSVVQAWAAHRADTDGDAVRVQHQRPCHRRSVHREDLRLARHRRVVHPEHRNGGHQHRRGRHACSARS